MHKVKYLGRLEWFINDAIIKARAEDNYLFLQYVGSYIMTLNMQCFFWHDQTTYFLCLTVS